MAVDSSGSAELAVAVTGPSCELPVKVCIQLTIYIVFMKQKKQYFKPDNIMLSLYHLYYMEAIYYKPAQL